MIQALNLPKKVYFKAGCIPVALRELGEIYHCSRALLVTDPELYRAGIAAPVVDLLRKQGIRAAEFFTIGKRVSFADLRSALPKLHEFQPDVIVGVGGNNAMSAAKALLALYQDPELDLAAASADPARIPACTKAKLVLIATNFSSGAQNSPFAILENDEGRNCSLKGCPAAREKLHNAAALAGASYGNIVDEVTPRLPYFPTEKEVSINDNDVRCAELAERLGFDSCRALFAACQAL